MPERVRLDALKLERLKKLGLDERLLAKPALRGLSDEQRAKLLNVGFGGGLTGPVNLTPRVPSSDKNYLEYYNASHVDGGPSLFPDGFVIFDGKTLNSPAVWLTFTPIIKNKPHLVEFNVVLFYPSTVNYSFIVTQAPPFNSFEVLPKKSQVISVLVQPAADTALYRVTLTQKSQGLTSNATWRFESARVTSVG
ncbi:MAG TPA: hypothetical protein VF546_22145 [Pyrinomonadaceae bacterium]|jgi:hypothetical protein